MALAAEYAQERRKEERRKEVKSLDNALKQIITVANSSTPANELLPLYLAKEQERNRAATADGQ